MEEFNEKIVQKWEEVKSFASDPATKEKAQQIYGKVKMDTVEFLEKTKVKFNEVKEDGKVQDFLASASQKVEDTFTAISENETINKVKDNVSSTFEAIKNDEKVKNGVKKTKRATLSFAKKALSSIEKMLEDDEDVIVYSTQENDPEE